MIKKFFLWILVLFVITFMVGCTKEKNNETKGTQEIQNNIDMPQKNELTICSLYENVTMNAMIRRYNDQHPDVTINYSVMQEQNSQAVRNDLIKTLNTKLLAGKGPDILILDQLPVDSYIKKDVLMDISDIFLNPSIKDNMLSNITDSFITESGTYDMPTRFLFPYYGLREDAVNQMKSLNDIAAYSKSNDRSFMGPTTYGRLISNFLRFYSNEVFNEDVSINKEGLKSFMTNINTVAQETASYPGTLLDGYVPRTKEEGYLQYPDSLMWKNGTMVIQNYIKSFNDLKFLTAILQSMGGSYCPINNSFQPYCIVGITTTTKILELAKDFVMSLFEVKCQSIKIELGGIPVNEKALTMWKSSSYSNETIFYMSPKEEKEKVDYNGMTEDDVDQFINYVKALDNASYDDEDFMTIFADEGCGYMEGKKTLNQAVDDIINRYNLFLKESR